MYCKTIALSCCVERDRADTENFFKKYKMICDERPLQPIYVGRGGCRGFLHFVKKRTCEPCGYVSMSCSEMRKIVGRSGMSHQKALLSCEGTKLHFIFIGKLEIKSTTITLLPISLAKYR